jgi:hypothetical protein
LLKAAGMRKLVLLSSFVSLSLFGCNAPVEGELPEAGDTVAAAADSEGKADSASSLTVTTFTDDIGPVGTSETRKVFTSASGYRNYFGHKAPSSVDFGKQWVIFYSAGTRATAGYDVAIESASLSKSGLTLKVTTQLTSPGLGCLTAQHVTKPYVLGTIGKQKSSYVQFYTDDVAKDCTPPGPTCGGIAGLQCPGHGKCVDNPNDSCDPAHGGADCGGNCVCIDNIACTVGSTFNSDPTVCACVPDVCVDKVACMVGYHWDSTPGVCKCVADGTCASDSDCTIADDYCGGCACDALGPGQSAKTCSNPVNCFAEPCAGKVAWCNPVSHKCEARP